ncbi:MAG: hypothetical protein ABIO57_02195 [Candidatus Paceibacterota bacterium]
MKHGSRDSLRMIKKLVRKYFNMGESEPIEKPPELLLFFIINKVDHPHNGLPVYISRKALKHFVERRKAGLSKNNNLHSLNVIYFIINHLYDSVVNFDFYQFEPYFKHFYSKKHPHLTKGELRILLEKIESSMEIISIHIRR